VHRTTTPEVVPLASGFTMAEGPRWRDGRWWFSDLHGGRVMTLGEDGVLATVVDTEHPSGLGWLLDGSLVFSTLYAPHVKRLDVDGGIEILHDLGDRGPSLNDMVVGPDGRLYVDLYLQMGQGPPPGEVVLITPEGRVESVAAGLSTPNGLVITPDGSTLIVSETFAGRLLAYPIKPDGTLGTGRVFAELGRDDRPDGLCVDAEGAVWVAHSDVGGFTRVLEGGTVTHRIETPGRWSIAPALGGADGRTLFLSTAETSYQQLGRGECTGFIDIARVDVPGDGW
jgi:sugar lactone lactonase YvrE